MNKDDALKLARELDGVIEDVEQGKGFDNVCLGTIKYVRDALADSALDRMAENARELGLDYEPPCKTGSQCTSKCQQCDEPHEQPHCNDCGGFDPECPLAQPAQRKPWVGLTEEEIKECFKITPDQYLPWHIYQKIEAKLKEKNA